jgi:hypothetical protein
MTIQNLVHKQIDSRWIRLHFCIPRFTFVWHCQHVQFCISQILLSWISTNDAFFTAIFWDAIQRR